LSKHFHRSRLVRLLADTTLLEANASRQDFAQRMSLWLNAADTVRLHAVLQPLPPAAPSRAGALPRHELATRLSEALRALEAQFTQAIAHDTLGLLQDREELASGYGTARKRHLDLQRQMELKATPLRAQFRQAMARVSAPMRHLATLDAVMEQTLGAREQKLLGLVPVFLEKRFEQLRRASQNPADVTPAETTPAGVVPAWLADFSQTWQAVLGAELTHRLLPLQGLVDAMNSEEETTT
jgi:hypothetical protein